MRSVALTASLAAALWLGMPCLTLAQEPAPASNPAPDPPVKPVREYAVPRSERVVVREPQAAERAPKAASEPQAVPRDAKPAVTGRQDTGSADAGRRRALAHASSAPANVSDAKGDDQERPGAVRRPPSGNSGRGGRPPDRAVPRASAPRQDRDRDRDRGWGRRVYVSPDYWGYRYYDPYYSGLGYFYYSPWGWTPSFYGHPYGYGSGYGGRYVARGWDVGAVKLKVDPQDAEVYVDGYYAGQVDDFDGFWQSLKLDSGAYRIEVRKPGFETLQFDVRVQPDRTITFRGEMQPLP